MNKNERYVAEHIQKWVWSGFYTHDDIDRMIDDIVDEESDVAELKSLIGPALRSKLRAERGWPPVTDCERLDQVFVGLHAAGVCALANTGNTMSDGHEHVAEVFAAAPAGHYRGFCFYHGQDVDRAVDGHGVFIAFGDIKGDSSCSVQVGVDVADALRAAGFVVDWNGSIATRIEVPVFDWKRRASSDAVPTTGAMVDHWHRS